MFSLPLHELVAAWLLETVLMAVAATAALYALAGLARAARARLLALAAVLLLVLAWRVRLEQLALVLPHHDGAVTTVDADAMAFGYDRSRLQTTGEVLLSADFRVGM